MPDTPIGRSTTTPSAHPPADVRWADFVADLPALIHPASPNASSRHGAPLTRGSQRQHVTPAARRVHATGSHVPRGYRMRRGKPGTALAVRREQSAPPAERERPEPPMIHATPVSTLMLPRIGHDVRMALAPADRMFLGAMSLMGGAVMAAIVAVLAQRGRSDAVSAATRTTPSAQVAAAIVTPVPHPDSMPHGTTVPAASATADSTAASTPTPHEKARVMPTAPSREVAAAPSRSPRSAARPPRRAKPAVVTLGRSEQPEAAPAKSAATPPRATPQPPATVMTSPAPAPSLSSAASGAASPAPAPAAQNINVAEELRAIHAEIEARRKHVDSLAHALDSLNKAKP